MQYICISGVCTARTVLAIPGWSDALLEGRTDSGPLSAWPSRQCVGRRSDSKRIKLRHCSSAESNTLWLRPPPLAACAACVDVLSLEV